MRRLVFLLGLLCFALAGCDQRELIQKMVPKDKDRFARDFLQQLHEGDLDAAFKKLVPGGPESDARAGLQKLHEIFAQGKWTNVETLGFQWQAQSGQPTMTQLNYQIRIRDDLWLSGFVLVAGSDNDLQVRAARFNHHSKSLEEIHAFSSAEMNPIHYLVLLGTLTVPVICLVALILCVRTKLRRKWLWIIFIILPIGKISLNWTTGEWDYQVLAFQLFGASCFTTGVYAPWIISFSYPLGAVLFFVKRRSLTAATTSAPPPPLIPAQ